MKHKLNYDKLGIATSILCAIHCTLLPLFISSLSLWGFEILENKAIEYSMIAITFVLGIFSLWHGYRHHHHQRMPLLLFGTGFICLVMNQVLAEQYIFVLIPLAAICIILAHVMNIYYNRRFH
jgi:hypothetical protein